jgi:hypothetical protein
MWTILAPSKIFSPQQEFLIDRSGDVGRHPRPKHLGFPLDLLTIESEIVDAVFQSEKTIRGEPVESCKLRYFNSFEFIDHTELRQRTSRVCLKAALGTCHHSGKHKRQSSHGSGHRERRGYGTGAELQSTTTST